jgi:hypothetical protein
MHNGGGAGAHDAVNFEAFLAQVKIFRSHFFEKEINEFSF